MMEVVRRALLILGLGAAVGFAGCGRSSMPVPTGTLSCDRFAMNEKLTRAELVAGCVGDTGPVKFEAIPCRGQGVRYLSPIGWWEIDSGDTSQASYPHPFTPADLTDIRRYCASDPAQDDSRVGMWMLSACALHLSADQMIAKVPQAILDGDLPSDANRETFFNLIRTVVGSC